MWWSWRTDSFVFCFSLPIALSEVSRYVNCVLHSIFWSLSILLENVFNFSFRIKMSDIFFLNRIGSKLGRENFAVLLCTIRAIQFLALRRGVVTGICVYSGLRRRVGSTALLRVTLCVATLDWGAMMQGCIRLSNFCGDASGVLSSSLTQSTRMREGVWWMPANPKRFDALSKVVVAEPKWFNVYTISSWRTGKRRSEHAELHGDCSVF